MECFELNVVYPCVDKFFWFGEFYKIKRKISKTLIYRE